VTQATSPPATSTWTPNSQPAPLATVTTQSRGRPVKIVDALVDDLFNIFVRLKWPDGVTCRHCGSTGTYFISTVKRWKCRHCRRQFTLKTGTIMEDSPLGLAVWNSFFEYVVDTARPTSCHMTKVTGVTQESTWSALRRIRAMLDVDEEAGEEAVANFIDRQKQLEIVTLRGLGHSVRRISELVGCSKMTVQRYMQSLADKIDGRPEPTYGVAALLCDNCRIRPVREDCEFWRPTRRTGHKFCSVKCYGVLRDLGFDYDAAEIYHTNQKLKQETREWQQQESGSPSLSRTPPI
jgi:transposase-like protein